MRLQRVLGSFCGLKYNRFKFILNLIGNGGIFRVFKLFFFLLKNF